MATAMRTKVVAKRSDKYLKEALYHRLFWEGISPQSIRRQLEDFLKSRKRVYKWEVVASIRKLCTHKRMNQDMVSQWHMNYAGLLAPLQNACRDQPLHHMECYLPENGEED